MPLFRVITRIKSVTCVLKHSSLCHIRDGLQQQGGAGKPGNGSQEGCWMSDVSLGCWPGAHAHAPFSAPRSRAEHRQRRKRVEAGVMEICAVAVCLLARSPTAPASL